MTATRLSSIILIFLIICLRISHSGVKKIKIHVPYYVKHVHHFKKVYVPKIHVIKHEHHHKKEYDHHHHHHEVYKSRPHKSYDKSSYEYPDEYLHHDFFYDDFDSKSFRTHGKRRVKPWKHRAGEAEQHYNWRDADNAEYKDDSGEDEDDFTAFQKNYYFKRRSDDANDKGKIDVQNQKEKGVVKELGAQESGTEEEEDGVDGNDSADGGEEEEEEETEENEDNSRKPFAMEPIKNPNVISITTTHRPLR